MSPVTHIEPVSEPGEPYYATIAEVRAALSVDADALPDAEAVALIEGAEDLIDARLGARPVDPATGRRVVPSDVESWRAAKLARATILVAIEMYQNPDAYALPATETVKGPDFEVKPTAVAGSYPIPQAARLALISSGLRVGYARVR